MPDDQGWYEKMNKNKGSFLGGEYINSIFVE